MIKTIPDVFANRADLASDVWNQDIVFEKGKTYLVEANSGTGKSSLCSFIYGYRNDYQGQILFDEEGHMLGELADRYSDILASVLLDKCDKSTAFYGTYAQLELAVYENYVTKQ